MEFFVTTYLVGLNFCNNGIYLNLTVYRHHDPISDHPMINLVEKFAPKMNL